METTEVMSTYAAKAIEYLIAVAYLVLFVPFWRYVQGGAPVRATRPVRDRQPVSAFQVPDHVMLHPGHGWVSANADDTVTVGIDDFARKLLGPVAGIELPAPGARLAQGAAGWTLETGGERLDMVAPLDGTVVAVNERVLRDPELLTRDPYGEGWLLRMRPADLARSVGQLLTGAPARRWIDGVFEQLRARMTPELGLVLQDGGQPVSGIARAADPEGWGDLARQFLSSSALPAHIKREESR
jgi:glycine cleavage system H protein